jgi:hypothetical protein
MRKGPVLSGSRDLSYLDPGTCPIWIQGPVLSGSRDLSYLDPGTCPIWIQGPVLSGSRDLSYLLCFQYSLRPFLSHIIIIPVSAVLFVSFIALFSSSFHFSKKYLSQLSFLSYLILRISFFAYCYSSFLFFLLGASKSIALYCIPYLTLPLISLSAVTR